MFSSIIKNAYDLHVHVWPEIIPRKYTVQSLAKEMDGKLTWVAVKNHMYPTIFGKTECVPSSIKVIYSVTLNHPVGGMNAEAVKASAMISHGPIIVRFPTIHSRIHLRYHSEEIPKEWVGNTQFVSRLSKDLAPVVVIDDSGILTSETMQVLDTMKTYELILATWHLDIQESFQVIDYACRIGINKKIITHPIYHVQDYSIEDQKRLVDKWCRLELPAAMWYIDHVPIEKMIYQIRNIWVDYYFLSSDSGQLFSDSPDQVLNKFCIQLYQSWLTEKEIKTMLENTVQIIES